MSLVLGDRQTGALLTLVVVLTGCVMSNRLLTAVVVLSGVLLLAEVLRSRIRPVRIRWALISRGLTVFTVVMLLAIGIRSVQDGRLAAVAEDLYLEGPLQPRMAATVPVDAQHPDVYLILLDGYPRSDKLLAEFGIDNTGFVGQLERRGFAVADASRSNYLETQLTLLSMFGGGHVQGSGLSISNAGMRRTINDAAALRPFMAAGYQTVSIPSDFEIVTLRRVDRLLDTGQPNEFERLLIDSTILPIITAIDPGYMASQHADRVTASLQATVGLATSQGPARLVFVHVASPHAPMSSMGDSVQLNNAGIYNMYDDRQTALHLGEVEYARRLGDQTEFLNRRVTEITDEIERSGRPAIVVLFSDHGSGVRFDPVTSSTARQTSTCGARTSWLSVEWVTSTSRSTLVNVIPRIAHQLFGTPYTPAVEDIRVMQDHHATSVTIPEPTEGSLQPAGRTGAYSTGLRTRITPVVSGPHAEPVRAALGDLQDLPGVGAPNPVRYRAATCVRPVMSMPIGIILGSLSRRTPRAARSPRPLRARWVRRGTKWLPATGSPMDPPSPGLGSASAASRIAAA